MKSKIFFYLILLTLFASLIPAVHAQTFSVIHSFTGAADNGYPYAGVTIRGNALYGTTGGQWPYGATVYRLARSGSNWLFSTLAGCADCGLPARAVFGPDGHLYSTSTYNGMYGWGTIFKLTPQVGPCRDLRCLWTVNVVHDFTGSDGYTPGYGDLIWDQQGNMYGTTSGGGSQGNGVAFEMTPSGDGYTETMLYDFPGEGGYYPMAGLVFDSKGNLFGTTSGGGLQDGGVIYELTNVPGVGWTEHVLYKFRNTDDGKIPFGGLIFDSAGNLYGTTSWGGSGNGGTVFELSPSGDTWTFKLLYSFSAVEYSCGPWAALTMDGAGNLYGTTKCAGMYGFGNVFKLSNTANGWVYTSLYDFTNGTDGAQPISNVSIDTDGTLYGTAGAGGDMNCGYGYGCGVVWMIKP